METLFSCSKCREDKPAEAFYKDRSKKRGLSSYCKVCTSARSRDAVKHNENSKRWQRENREKVLASRIQARYGLALEDYYALLAKGCSVCGTLENLVIDHDHDCCPDHYSTCGSCIRDVLCQRHNLAEGNYSVDELEGLLAYKRKHQVKSWAV